MNTLKQAKISFVGDSHVNLWRYIKKNDLCAPLKIVQVAGKAGKTAQGLAKPSNADWFLNKISGGLNYLGINFGEVDCAFAIWSRMAQNQSSKQQEINFAVSQIEQFALKAQSLKTENIVILSPIIPLVKSYSDNGYLKYVDTKKMAISKDTANKARQKRLRVKASHKERTGLVLSFEEALRTMAYSNMFKFMTINHLLLDPKKSIVKDKFMDLGGGWHLPVEISAPMWVSSCLREDWH